MEIVYLLIPVALLIVAIIMVVFFWAIRSDQFEDMEGPAHRILMDDDNKPAERKDQDEAS